MTDVSFRTFKESDVLVFSTRKRAHSDGITYIDVITKYRAYATSSYDCCASVWSLLEHKCLGSLYLGGRDPNWTFKVDEDVRKKAEMNEALENWKELEEEKISAEKEKSKIKRKFKSQEQTLLNANSILNKVREFVQ